MKHSKSRRTFLRTSACTALGMFIPGTNIALPEPGSIKMEGPIQGFWDEFSEEENQLIQNSKMAKDILSYRLGCAESIFSASVKFLGQPEETAKVARCFNGGIGKKDLCGLLTGSFMSFGLASTMFPGTKEEISKQIRDTTQQYWEWWLARSPRHCHEMRPMYSHDRENYKKMIQRVALKVEEFIKPAIAKT